MIYTKNGKEYPLLETPPQSPMREELTFSSDVRKSVDGKEERISLRPTARMLLTMEYPIADMDVTEYNALISVKWDKYLVPLWHLATNNYTTQAVSGNHTSIDFGTEERLQDHGFPASGETTILLQRYGETVVEEATVSGTGFQFPTPADWDATNKLRGDNTWLVMPVVFGQPVNRRGFTGSGFDDTLSVIFDIDRPPSPSSGSPQAELRGIEVLTISSTDSVKDEEQEREEKLDWDLGRRQIIKDWSRPERTINYDRILWHNGINADYPASDWRNIADDLMTFRQFLFRRRGRSLGFLLPSFRRDAIIANVSGNSFDLLVTEKNIEEVMAALKQNPFLFVRKADQSGEAFIIDVSSATTVGRTISGLVSDAPINTTGIEFVSLAVIARLQADKITFQWQGNQTATVSTKFVSTDPIRERGGRGVVLINGVNYYLGNLS